MGRQCLTSTISRFTRAVQVLTPSPGIHLTPKCVEILLISLTIQLVISDHTFLPPPLLLLLSESSALLFYPKSSLGVNLQIAQVPYLLPLCSVG